MIQLTVAEGTVLFKLHEEKYTNPQTHMINSVLCPPPPIKGAKIMSFRRHHHQTKNYL